MVQAENFRVSEYDAFGPLIYNITEKNPIPSLFQPYYKEHENCLMLIKIPRDIERRKAKPDMDLYDYVIGMYEDYGCILNRNEDKVEEIRFYYNEVESIENHRSLLLGKLSIHLKDNTLIIPYNAVSIEIIFELIKIIRDKYVSNTYEIKSEFSIDENVEIEDLYKNLIKDRESHGDVFPIKIFQSAINLNDNNVKLGQKILGFIREKLLLSTIHLLNHRELLIINRGKLINFGKKPVNSYNFIYIPIEKIDKIKIEECKEYNNIQMVIIETNINKFKCYFDERNEKLIKFYEKIIDIKSNK
jgi:hypothetical protein